MSTIDDNKLEAIGQGVMIGANALNDSELLGLGRSYKRSVAARYRLLNEGDIADIESDQLNASLKLDGQLHFLYKAGDECFLYNVNGRVIKGLGLLDELAPALADLEPVVLVGELYVNGDGGRTRVYDVSSALGAGNGDKARQLSFAVFDLLQLRGESCWDLGFTGKQEKLAEVLPAEGLAHHVQQQEVDNKTLAQLYRKWVGEQDQEGIICVDEQNHTVYKIKPRHNVDAVILGFTENPDLLDSVRVLLTGLMRPDGSFQVFAKVGTGFDDEQRKEFYQTLKAMEVPSAYRTTDRNHTLFTMVRPEIVIEFAFHDLIWENSSGKPEMKPVLTYQPQEGYQAMLPQAFVSALGPVFKRIREDKQVSPNDLRLTQLQEFFDLDNLEQAAESLELAKSSLLQREVFTKTTKGLISVRKFLAWKTNKEQLDSNYPAYAFCFTDFSPGRKDPMKRVMRSANTEEDIVTVYDGFKEEQVKRGWVAAD